MFSKLHFSRPFASSTILPWGFFKEERRVRRMLNWIHHSHKMLFLLCVLQFRREEDAEKAVMDLNNRWFNGQPIHAELSPVTDFREACCRQYEMGWGTAGNMSSLSAVLQYLEYFRWTLVCAGFGKGSMEECLQQDNPTLSFRVEPAAERPAKRQRPQSMWSSESCGLYSVKIGLCSFNWNSKAQYQVAAWELMSPAVWAVFTCLPPTRRWAGTSCMGTVGIITFSCKSNDKLCPCTVWANVCSSALWVSVIFHWVAGLFALPVIGRTRGR